MSATDRSELDGYEALVSSLQAAAPVAPEHLRQRVLAGAPARRPRRLTLPRRRLVLVLVPAAAALAVGAALVHGFVSSGSQSRATPDAGARLLGPGATTAANGSVAAAPHAAAKSREKTLGSLTQSQARIAIPKGRLVHADATLQVQVANHSALSRATNRATQIVASLGGYAQSVEYRSARRGGGSSYLALRVPVGKAQTAIARLESLGRLVSQQLSTQDLQQQPTTQSNRIGSLRRAIAVYEQALQSGSLSASQRVDIQIRLENARHSLTRLRKARQGTVASGATADISLTLTAKQHAGAVPPSRGRFDRMLHSAAGFLGLEGMIVLYALVVLAPVLILGGLAWALVRGRRRRDEKRLLATT
jgi:Domain of unknown function (DUF4349)